MLEHPGLEITGLLVARRLRIAGGPDDCANAAHGQNKMAPMRNKRDFKPSCAPGF
jgi:hypothetical protein